MKSLQAKLLGMLSLMLVISLILATLLVMNAREESHTATIYEIKDKIAGHMNSAAAWQAIERGVGATILGSENPPSGLLAKFADLGKKGDAEVALGIEGVEKMLEIVDNPDLSSALSEWKSTHQTLKATRPKVTGGSIERSGWIPVASKNIAAEFKVRDITFAPKNAKEQVLSYNAVVRANVATLAEYAGRERAVLGGFIGSGTPISPKAMETLKGYRALVENASSSILGIRGLSSTPPSLVSAISAYEQEFLGPYQQLREQVYAASAEGKPYPVSGSDWIGKATKAINTALAISNAIGGLSEKAVEDIQSAATRSIIFNLVLFAISVGVFIFVFFFIRRSIVNPIYRIINHLSEGSSQISSASGEISTSSQSLAEGSTEQASSLEETSSALDEMASQTRQNADNANQANSLAATTRGEAENGNQTMAEMIESMKAINSSSEEISKIIKVIEEIAFQTNLLALNAAVEAARAGEHGKGFAVVAEEVRNLAQRSATAAKDTATLIENAVKNAAEGGEMANKAGEVLSGIVVNVKQVTDLVGEIAAASNEQAQGVDQINTAVSQMDKITQENAANAEESAAASEELNAQAESLNEVVSDLNQLVSGQSGGSRAGHAPRHAPPPKQKRALPPRPAPKQAAARAPKAAPSAKDADDLIPLDDDFGDF